jgi:CRISPR-associated endonuclease Cas2
VSVPVRYLITYDIADDNRREDVAIVLSGYGPRVQLSVFECDLRSAWETAGLRAKLRPESANKPVTTPRRWR